MIDVMGPWNDVIDSLFWFHHLVLFLICFLIHLYNSLFLLKGKAILNRTMFNMK